MNFLKKKFVKWTSNTIVKSYLAVKMEDQNLKESDILKILVIKRGPFWRLENNIAFFKGKPAFIIEEGKMEIGAFMMLINIWETVIADPGKVSSQYITKRELEEMIIDIESIVFDLLLPNPQIEDILGQRSIIEQYLEMSIDTIGGLGGRVF